MNHRIYAAPFATLEPRLLDTIAELQQTDPLTPVSILVGSNVLASYLTGRIAQVRKAAANVRFYTFLDLVMRLGQGAEAEAPQVRLSALTQARLLEDLIEDHTPRVFRQVAGFSGFRSALLETFHDLRDAGVTADIMDRASQELANRGQERTEHLEGLAALYRGFRERASVLRGIDDDFRLAISRASVAPQRLGTAGLLIYGLYDVTGQQAELLDALEGHLDLTYLVPFAGDASSGFARKFLESRAEMHGVPIEYLPAAEGGSPGHPLEAHPDVPLPGLVMLAERLFANPDADKEAGSANEARLPADRSFALVSVPGDSRAAVEVVREILQAVRDGVIRGYYEAAVVLRHPEEDLPVLTEALRIRGIPYYVHGGTSFARRPLARAALAICRLDSELYSRESILKAFDLVAASLPAEGAAAYPVPEWRQLSNDYRFLAGANAWETGTLALLAESAAELERARLTVPEEGEDGDNPRSVASLARKLESARMLRSGWRSLGEAAGGWPKALSWGEWAELLETRLEPLLGASSDWPAFMTGLDQVGCLDRVHGASSKPRVRRDRLVTAFAESLEALSVQEGRFQQDGVNLLSTAAARGLRFPLVIVPGLDEGRFPSRLRQDPLLLDAERRQIGRPSRLPLKALRGEEEKLLFDLAVRSAIKRVVLMSSRLDEGADRERIPSDFFLRAAGAARGGAVNLRELTPESVPGFRSVSLEDPAPAPGLLAVDEGEIRLRLITENRAASARALRSIAAEEPRLLDRPLSYDRARWMKSLTGYDGRIRQPELLDRVREILGPAAGQVSASRIEEYARCPYLHYLKRVVGLEKWEEVVPAAALDVLERGRALHEVLETFLREIGGTECLRSSEPALWAILESRARDRLAQIRPGGIPDLLWEIELDSLLLLLRHWLSFEKARWSEGLLPAHFERPFGAMGSADDAPPFDARAGDRIFSFRGRIDRIDLSPGRQTARVIDYKIGRLPESVTRKPSSQLMGGERVQLAVYRGALQSMPDLGSLERVEGEYLHLQPADAEVALRSYSDLELREAAARLVQMLEVIGALIEGGIFFARTAGSVYPDGHCRFCDFLSICGKDRAQREQHKASDPAVERFARLLRIDSLLEEEP